MDLRVALHYIILKCFLFSKRNAGALVFQHSKKRDKDERKKKAKLYFTSRLKGSLALQIHDCSIFWGTKAAFEAGRYVLIICRLNDDTGFIINGPHPSTLPLPHNSPECEWVLALAAFALFDLSVITPLFGDHTTSFMLNKEALEVFFLYKFQTQLSWLLFYPNIYLFFLFHNRKNRNAAGNWKQNGKDTAGQSA